MIKKGGDEDRDKDDKDKKEKNKEAEKVVFFKFPQPENYRNWRLRVREALVAASNKPDHAFNWLSKVWDKKIKVDDLRDADGFGSLSEFEYRSGVKLFNENLVTFRSNWDTVLSGMKVAPEDPFLEPLFHRQIEKCKSISHDIAIYERATEGAKERDLTLSCTKRLATTLPAVALTGTTSELLDSSG